MVIMAWIVEHKDGKHHSLPAKIVEPKHAKSALSPLAWRILQSLSGKPTYPKDLSRRLKVHEQKVYYHIRNLEKSGLVKVIKQENTNGITTKFYSLVEPAFALLLKDTEPSPKLFSLNKGHENFLFPFVSDGNLNALVVLGSPEPHGPSKVRAEDGPYSINLGLFFGTFLNYVPKACIKLDTEVREEDLKNNLILIGGPAVNKIVEQVNEGLPIRFVKKGSYYTAVFSSITNKLYSEDENGIVLKAKNPYEKNKHILVVAGRRANGTKAAILSFIHKFDELCAGNNKRPNVMAKVVEGLDMDSDGVIDAVEIKE